MIELKGYQHRTLDALREFFRACARGAAPEAAFALVRARNGLPPATYVPRTEEGLSGGMPYVCMRVPTGGGKTLLACHAAGFAASELLHSDRAAVLWLVPSRTILAQTADALRDPRHPYRRALELPCGAVEVMTIDEALRISRAAVEGQTVVIVATIQSSRVDDTAKRKVYEQNDSLAEHFAGLDERQMKDLLPGADGKPKPSLVNVLRLRRPVVIVDEAHNARTDLSFKTLGDFRPSCVVEFTATPDRKKDPSNVLHRVSAAELKAEEMVKLPLRVVSRHPSQRKELLADAVALRAALEKLAGEEGRQTGEYLRPIMLIQAERVDQCEPLREQLAAEFDVDKAEIKISTNALEELEEVDDILSPKCPVRFVITVQKLREGWDCPFAHVLCSLKETHSETAIEQIVGRVLRLPGARAKKRPELNCSYVLSVSPSIGEVLAELRDALEKVGFTAAEAEKIILPVPQGVLPLGAQPQIVKVSAAEIDAAAARALNASLGGKARIDPEAGEIAILVPLSEDETDGVAACVKDPEAQARVRSAAAAVAALDKAFGGSGKTRAPSPCERGADFAVPVLSVKDGESFFEFDDTFLLEHPWRLSVKDASLDGAYNPWSRPNVRSGVLDVGAAGEVKTEVMPQDPANDFVAALHRQTLVLGIRDDWSAESLVAWLDWQIDHQDIVAGESEEFIRKAIRDVMTKFAVSGVGVLALDRFRLRDEIARRIQQHRESERKSAFQQLLLPDSPLAVAPERAINFKTIEYAPGWTYDGAFQFKKHYFPGKPGELEERTPSGKLKEEFRCAQFIDDLPEVEFWIRNLPRRDTSFRLQTSTDWFYPDFLCRLTDGRVMAIEYKGADRYDAADAEEKRAVGKTWEKRSGGRCLFVMPTDGDFSVITKAVHGS